MRHFNEKKDYPKCRSRNIYMRLEKAAFCLLFTHTKVLKNRAQNFVGSDLSARNLGKVEQTFAEILRHKIARKLSRQSMAHAANIGKSGLQGCMVTGIGNDELTLAMRELLGQLGKLLSEHFQPQPRMRTESQQHCGRRCSNLFLIERVPKMFDALQLL